MLVQQYNQIAQSGDIPNFGLGGVNMLCKMYDNSFTPPSIDSDGPWKRMNFKDRVKNINEFEARIENGNIRQKTLSLVKTAVIIGIIVAGAIITSRGDFTGPLRLTLELGLCLLAFGVEVYVLSGMRDREEYDSCASECADIPLMILKGPFYDIYKAFKFGSPSDRQALNCRKTQLVQDLKEAKAALPNNLDPKVLEDLQSFLSNKGLLYSQAKWSLEVAKLVLEEIKKLHKMNLSD